MSRIDEALRRAISDPGNVHAPVGFEPGPVLVDRSVLERYSVERPSAVVHERSVQLREVPAAPPAPARRDRSTAFHASLEAKFVVGHEASEDVVEQYRRLAATLHAAQGERGLKTLLVSSAVPNEGKTLTVANLALTLSESYGRRVLVIDADLRRPSIHKLFSVTNVTGLAEAVRSHDGIIRPIQLSPTLSVLPAGRAGQNLMAALSSDRMRELVADAASSFDWVILDSPPVGVLSDAQLVARGCDGVLFVIAAGSTPYHLVQRSIAELGPERIVGVVLNRAPAESFAVSSYYGRY